MVYLNLYLKVGEINLNKIKLSISKDKSEISHRVVSVHPGIREDWNRELKG